jgi:hypothetical protein
MAKARLKFNAYFTQQPYLRQLIELLVVLNLIDRAQGEV